MLTGCPRLGVAAGANLSTPAPPALPDPPDPDQPRLTPQQTRQYKPAIVPTIKDLFDLTGKVAIVTGGSRGLGQEMAEGLAEAGARLMLCARRDEWLTPTVKEMRARGFAVEGTTCDVSKPADVQAVVDKTLAAYGQIDILVNNAGLSWGDEPRNDAARQVAQGHRGQPDRRVSLRAGRGPRDAQAGVRADHQRGVHRRAARLRQRAALRRATPQARPG